MRAEPWAFTPVSAPFSREDALPMFTPTATAGLFPAASQVALGFSLSASYACFVCSLVFFLLDLMVPLLVRRCTQRHRGMCKQLLWSRASQVDSFQANRIQNPWQAHSQSATSASPYLSVSPRVENDQGLDEVHEVEQRIS